MALEWTGAMLRCFSAASLQHVNYGTIITVTHHAYHYNFCKNFPQVTCSDKNATTISKPC